MTQSVLAGVHTCVFDAYGTLFNTDSAAQRLQGHLGDKTGPLATLWRDKQLQYTWLRTVQGRHADFEQVTRDALAHALQALGLAPALAPELMAAFNALDVYAEVPAVVRQLRADGYRTAILSNGTPAMLSALLENSAIGGLFDAVFSVEAAGCFKPDARVYQLPLNGLGLHANQICFVSSNAWDAHGAAAFGMQVVWCNRRNQSPDRLPGSPAAQVRTLEPLPALLQAAPRAPAA